MLFAPFTRGRLRIILSGIDLSLRQLNGCAYSPPLGDQCLDPRTRAPALVQVGMGRDSS